MLRTVNKIGSVFMRDVSSGFCVELCMWRCVLCDVSILYVLLLRLCFVGHNFVLIWSRRRRVKSVDRAIRAPRKRDRSVLPSLAVNSN